jgi:group I intron endonuclease
MTNITPYGLIYKTTNLINGKIYIGQTVKIDKYLSGKYYGSGIYLNRAIKQIGVMNFKTEIVCYAQNKQELDELEIKYITEYQSYNPLGYNISKGGDGGNTIKFMSEQNKANRNEKLSIAKKGNKNMLGKKHTNETRKKIAVSNIGNKNMLGRTLSIETKSKISKSLSGREKSQQHIAKLSNSMKEKFANETHSRIGKKHTAETINKLKIINTGKILSLETRHKMSISRIGRKFTYKASQCPHCGLNGDIRNLTRWHFNNCKKYEQAF